MSRRQPPARQPAWVYAWLVVVTVLGLSGLVVPMWVAVTAEAPSPDRRSLVMDASTYTRDQIRATRGEPVEIRQTSVGEFWDYSPQPGVLFLD